MRKYIHAIVLTILGFLFVQSVQAGSDPRCDDLRGPDVTPGLFGLCNAYWSSGENPDVLYAYNDLAVPGDPPMPGLTPCPCWTTDNLIDAGLALDPYSCDVFDSIAVARFDEHVQLQFGIIGKTDSPGFCFSPLVSGPVFTLGDETNACRTDIMAIGAVFDFDYGLGCLPFDG
jgi:hypothetical protein